MNITKSASILDWRTNTQGRWTAVVDDIAPSTQNISFGNGYTAIVTNRKITVENSARPSGTVTYAVEDVANTAYAGNLAAVGSVKDNLDVVTGERNVRLGSYTFTGEETISLSDFRHVDGYYCDVFPSTLVPNIRNDYATVSKPNMICGFLEIRSYASIYNTEPVSVGISLHSSYSFVIRVPNYIANSSSTLLAWLAGKTIYYELAEPTSAEETPQPLSLSAGANTASMTDTSTGDKPVFPMSYDGTDYAIAAKSSRVYLKDVDGTVERVTGVTSIPVRGGRDNVMDLTRMFGAGLEPGTLDAFYSLFPAWRGYKLPYNPGNLLNFKGTGLKSVGFNQFSGVYSEEGKYLTSTGTLTTNTSYNVTDYLRAIPGQTYRLTAYGNAPSICWYTYNKALISGTAYGHSSIWQEDVFTAPANAYWVRFSVYMPRVAETCFYFQWSGPRNGDYEPYWDYTRPVPTLTYFPDGMNGRGDVYDEINDRQAIRRFGVVYLGTLTWTWNSNTDYGYWVTTSLRTAIKKETSSASLDVALISELYTHTMPYNANKGLASYVGAIAENSTGDLAINNGSTTVSPTGWLVYELATPVVTTFSEEISTTARISDFGTEECLPANGYDPVTAPFRGLVLYQDDYARTITKLPENYQSQDSMDNLLALLGQLHNGTIIATFDSANQVYTYQFTPNA